MKFGYYPGCTLETSAREYDQSMREVARHMGIELEEIEDWGCCGASPASVEPALALALSTRNLALAEKQGVRTLVTPCSGCFFKTAKAAKLSNNGHSGRASIKTQVHEALARAGHAYGGTISVRHAVDLFVSDDIGLEAVRAKVVAPLNGLRVVCYYGCLMTRPNDVTGHTQSQRPTSMDDLMEALGARALPYQHKTSCCGGPILLPKPEIAFAKTKALLDAAVAAGAECMVSGCPLCSANLDGKQRDIEVAFSVHYNLPILYFSQLIGLAFGLSPKRLGLHKNIVPTKKLLKRLSGSLRPVA